MEERKKELQKSEKKTKDSTKSEKSKQAQPGKAEKKFKELVNKLEENLRNRELLKAKKIYSKLNKVYSDLNEQSIPNERKIKMHAILMKEHDKLMNHKGLKRRNN